MSCIGQMLCAVVADTRAHAKRGAAAVKISYEDLPDPIFTLEVSEVKQTVSDPILPVDNCLHILLPFVSVEEIQITVGRELCHPLSQTKLVSSSTFF